MSRDSKIERGIALIAGLITIVQACFTLIASSPKIETPVSNFVSDLIFPSRVVIVGILGCISALSYAIIMRQIVKISIPLAFFGSAILSLMGAWFALLLSKVMLEPGLKNIPNAQPDIAPDVLAMILTVVAIAVLFTFSLPIVGIPVIVNEGEEESLPTPFFISTVIPFGILMVIALVSR